MSIYYLALNLSIYLIFFMSFSTSRKPIVGIYGNPEPIDDYTSNSGTVVVGSYVRRLQSMGAEVVALHQWYTTEEIDYLLSKINGVLFQGGGRDFKYTAKWETNGVHILNYAKQTGLPVWGTCMGFQFICDGLVGKEILTRYNHMTYLDKAAVTEEGKKCKAYAKFTEADFDTFQNKDSTIYFHTWGLSKEAFDKEEVLSSLFTITSYGNDADGNTFVNSIESKTGNIFGSQFHPEKTPYIRTDYGLEHTVDSMRISHKVGLGFMAVVYQNTNTMSYVDRMKYDFINTYGKGPEDSYKKENNSYYFIKKDSSK